MQPKQQSKPMMPKPIWARRRPTSTIIRRRRHMRHYPSMRHTGISMHMRPHYDRMHGRIDRRVVEEFRGHRRRHGSYVATLRSVIRVTCAAIPNTCANSRWSSSTSATSTSHRALSSSRSSPRRRRYTPGATADSVGRCNGGHRAIGEYGGQYGGQRVINADAQVTILGPDRMNIRLLPQGLASANASPVK